MSAENEAPSTTRRGRPYVSSTTALGAFIRKCLAKQRVTQKCIAPQLGMTPSRLSRLIAGKVTFTRPIATERWCRVLGLDEMNRKQFLELVAAAAASFALASGGTPVTVPSVRKHHLDLDLANDLATTLQRLLEHGEAQYVLETAQHWFNAITEQFSMTRDPHIARTQVRFGLLLGNAQEAAFPWFQRPRITINTYTALIEKILPGFPLQSFATERARILERRAPLNREHAQYAQSLADFDEALDLLRDQHNPELTITLFRNRAHIFAVLGNESKWMRDIQLAARVAGRLPEQSQRLHMDLLNYSQAEGYKRLAFTSYKPLAIQQREHYARQALAWFQNASPLKVSHTASHGVLADISEAQAMIWLDPQAAQVKLASLRTAADRIYPSLLAKIAHSEHYAQQRLLTKDNQDELFFDIKRDSPLR